MNLGIDPDRLAAAFFAIPGAALYGMYHLMAVISSGQQATTADYIKAIINVTFAIASGAILAYFLAIPLTSGVPIAILRDRAAVAFMIGAVGWELLPTLINKAKDLIRNFRSNSNQGNPPSDGDHP